MTRPLLFTHLGYILLFCVIVFLLRERIFAIYIQTQLDKDQGVELTKDISLFDKEGNVIGRLNRNVILMAPDIQDLRDTDLGDNARYKLLIDMKDDNFQALQRDQIAVYDLGRPSSSQ